MRTVYVPVPANVVKDMRVLHESRLILYADHVTSWPVTVCVLGEIGRCRRDNTLKFDLGRQLSCVTADVRL